MARWDEILTLPVQNPPTLEFSAADIVWSRVEGWRESMDRLALIPFSRVNDFVRGESNNKECPTRFHVEARRRRPPEMAYKPKVDGILEYILYWCSFGPDDHRKGGIVRPSRNYSTKRKTPAGRPNTKRGCVCHFIVKRLIAEPSVALIIYNQDKHVDKKGLPCHGPLDKKAAGTRAMFAPYISDELRLQIMSLLYVGVPVETIMQRHTEAVEKQGGPCNRDDLLTHRYVRRLERKIRRSTYELDLDDAVSIGMWIENHPNHIFFYEDFSESEPFVLGIQTEWQLQQMIRFGNRRLLAADSRFGTNKLKYPIYSLLVFDSNNNAIPVAWIMTPNFASGEIHKWMGALYDRVHTKDPTWKLGGFIIDDPLADVLTIREVFQCSVLISFWRVRHAWHKNLVKCTKIEMCAEMFRRLGGVISNICRGSGDMDSFEAFMEDFVDCSEFLDYFEATWFPRIETWTTALKALPLASMEVSAAIECYHHQLKLRLLNEKDSNVYQRADWLVDKLGTKVHSYYWLDEYSGKDNFARYWKDEWKSGLTPWRQALQIPDSDVSMNGKCAKVVSSENQEEVHMVLNPGSEFALCDCSWSRMGNLCKHVIKSTKIYRDRGLVAPSTSLFEYNRTLMAILHCPPHDSVIRDHAIALAASVQTQLNVLFDLENGSATKTTSVLREQQTAAEPDVTATNNRDDVDKDLMNESPSVSENQAEDLRNDSHSVTEKHEVAGETVNGTVADDIMLPAETSTGSFSVEQQLPKRLPNDNDFINPMENEAGDLLREKPNAHLNTCNAPRTVDGSQDDMLVDACCDGTATHTNKVSGGKNSITEDMMNVNPKSIQCFPSTGRGGAIDGVVVDGYSSQISGLNEKKASDASDVHPIDFMIVDTVENTTVIHHGAEKEPALVDCHNSIVENVNLEKTSVAMESGLGSSPENTGSEAQTVGISGVDPNICDVNGPIGISMQNTVAHSNGGMEVAICSSMDSSGMEIRPCSEKGACTDQTMDIALDEEVYGVNATKKNDGEQSLGATMPGNGCSGKAPEAVTSSVHLESLIEGDKLNAGIQSAAMDIQVSADQVEEVHSMDSSGVDEKDGMDLATDVLPATGGISSKIEERSSNCHAITDMTLI